MATSPAELVDEDRVLEVLEHLEHSKMELIRCQIRDGVGAGGNANFSGNIVSIDAEARLRSAPPSRAASRSPSPPVAGIEFEARPPKTYRWVAKLADDEEEGGARARAVRREVRFYSQVVPKLEALDKTPTAELMPNLCKLVHQEDEFRGRELLLLEHMGRYGFGAARDKRAGLDMAHCKLVLDWLAGLHGLAHQMMLAYPGGKNQWLEDNEWSQFPYQGPGSGEKDQGQGQEDPGKGKGQGQEDLGQGRDQVQGQNQLDHWLELAELVQTDPGQDYPARLRRLADSCREDTARPLGTATAHCLDRLVFEQLQQDSFFVTLCHLDPWFNNMLFKYDDEGWPEHVLLLDFQIASVCHPGNDLAHFLMSSTTPQFRHAHLEDLLAFYHTRLQEVAAAAANGSKKDLSWYTYNDLKRDYRNGVAYGFNFCIKVLPMVLANDDEDGGNEEEAILGERDPKKRMLMEKERRRRRLESNPLLKERLRGVFEEMIAAGHMD